MVAPWLLTVEVWSSPAVLLVCACLCPSFFFVFLISVDLIFRAVLGPHKNWADVTEIFHICCKYTSFPASPPHTEWDICYQLNLHWHNIFTPSLQFTLKFGLVLFLFSFYKDSSNIGLGAHPYPIWHLNNYIWSNLISKQGLILRLLELRLKWMNGGGQGEQSYSSIHNTLQLSFFT